MSEEKPCVITQILLDELVRYQPFTPCRHAVEAIIEKSFDRGFIPSLEPFSAVDPKYIRKEVKP